MTMKPSTWRWLSFFVAVGLVVSGGTALASDDPKAINGSWWSGSTDLGGGWRYLDWLGFFNVNNDPWVYHSTLEWMYVSGTTGASLWIYNPTIGSWLWTSNTAMPFLFRASDNTWLYYLTGTTQPSWFHNETTGLWERWPSADGASACPCAGMYAQYPIIQGVGLCAGGDVYLNSSSFATTLAYDTFTYDATCQWGHWANRTTQYCGVYYGDPLHYSWSGITTAQYDDCRQRICTEAAVFGLTCN